MSDFSRRQLMQSVVGLPLMFSALPALAAEYEELSVPQTTTAGEGRIEVLEFMWYGCPHCYSVEPVVNQWLENLPEDVVFVREAPALNRAWEPQSRAYYAADVMGVLEQFHEPMFTAIHEERRALRKPSDIAKFAGTLGIDEDAFAKAMKSFAVETRSRRAAQMAGSMKITGVPAFVVNGKYLTGPGMAGGNHRVFEVIDGLIELERQALAS